MVPTVSSSSSICREEMQLAGAPLYRPPLCAKWTRFTSFLQDGVRRVVVVLAVQAARRPINYALGICIISLATLAIGCFTNFRIEADYEVLYAPSNSQTKINMDWIEQESGFKDLALPITFIIHDHGSNVLSKQGVRQIFDVLETIQHTEGFDQICSQGQYTVDFATGTETNDCFAIAITRYWHHNRSLFEEQTQSDQDFMKTLSSKKYPGGIPLEYDYVLGKYQMSKTNNSALVFAESFLGTVLLPYVPGVEDFELAAMKNLLDLRREWQDAARKESVVDPNGKSTMQMECASINSYTAEFTRAIFADLPLTILVGVIMVSFCCLVFFKWHPVKSRILLGAAAVVTVTMSLSFGCGLMFIAGIPFTNMTMIFPFVLYGVGLDDTFVITGSFFRNDPKKDVILRIEETMEEIGLSITMTTITTMLAFALGMGSSVPGIVMLCLYALVTIGIDFVFQVTLFIAFLVLDERRVQANRRDACFCIKGRTESDDGPFDEETYNGHDIERREPNAQNWEGRLMRLYADQLLKPWIKMFVIVAFLGYFGLCVYRTTLITQEFNVEEFLPKNSFVMAYLRAIENYAQETIPIGVYFRHVDQSQESIQQQMKDYIDALVDGNIGEEPDFCWVRDFSQYQEFAGEFLGGIDMSNLTFTQQLTLALTDPRVKEVYGNDIVTDEHGNIKASRCWIRMVDLDFKNVHNQIEKLRRQQDITASQPINQGTSDDELPFFTMADTYFLWEFYAIAVKELVFNTVSGIVAVTVVAIFAMPHWSAVVFVLPLIVITYADMLGTLQLCNLHINVVTYVCLVVSIGLLVDFLMHILLRYYESLGATREEKVRDTLETMGVSVLVGGLSTFLAVIPLAWSTSKIIGTVFTLFFVMVTLGVLHGLIFLPVVLSLIGPSVMVQPKPTNNKDPHRKLTAETETGSTLQSRVTTPHELSLAAGTETDSNPRSRVEMSDGAEVFMGVCPPVVQVESQLQDGMIEAAVSQWV